MTTFKSTQPTDHKKKVVIKLGGSMLAGLNEVFFRQLKKIRKTSEVIIIHGGGPAINEALKKAAVQSTIIEGIRVTDEAAISIVAQTLIGQVNPMLVGQLNQSGIQAIGLNGQDGQLLACDYLNQPLYHFVGEIQQVHVKLLEDLLAMDFLPVVACIGADSEGQLLNINGDTVASAIALAFEADELLFVTDVDGVKIEGQAIDQTSKPQIDEWIEAGHIYGGMIPKVEAATNCVLAGVPAVKIVGANLQGTTIIGEKVLQ
ncbi:MAG: acetylglutamate kinase [Kurthia sp.]|nr:acetylglutamate kinase [Candidatus Kurthia equi]